MRAHRKSDGQHATHAVEHVELIDWCKAHNVVVERPLLPLDLVERSWRIRHQRNRSRFSTAEQFATSVNEKLLVISPFCGVPWKSFIVTVEENDLSPPAIVMWLPNTKPLTPKGRSRPRSGFRAAR